jgi:hypothetical protein
VQADAAARFNPSWLKASIGDTITYQVQVANLTIYIIDLPYGKATPMGKGTSLPFSVNGSDPVIFGTCRHENCTLGDSMMPEFYLNPQSDSEYGPITFFSWDGPGCAGHPTGFVPELGDTASRSLSRRRSFSVSRRLQGREQLDRSIDEGCGRFVANYFAANSLQHCQNIEHTCKRI